MVFRLAVNLTAKLQLLDHRCLVLVPRAVPYNETDPNLLRHIFELRHPCPEQVCDPMEGITGLPRFHNNNLCLGSLGEMSRNTMGVVIIILVLRFGCVSHNKLT